MGVKNGVALDEEGEDALEVLTDMQSDIWLLCDSGVSFINGDNEGDNEGDAVGKELKNEVCSTDSTSLKYDKAERVRLMTSTKIILQGSESPSHNKSIR